MLTFHSLNHNNIGEFIRRLQKYTYCCVESFAMCDDQCSQLNAVCLYLTHKHSILHVVRVYDRRL